MGHEYTDTYPQDWLKKEGIQLIQNYPGIA
jgi:hypothetical protein